MIFLIEETAELDDPAEAAEEVDDALEESDEVCPCDCCDCCF